MDAFELDASWGNELNGCPSAVTIRGLHLQGARFDGKYLSDLAADDSELASVPDFRLGWIPRKLFTAIGKLGIPLYADSTRELQIATVYVPCSDPNPWILTGVAFIVSGS